MSEPKAASRGSQFSGSWRPEVRHATYARDNHTCQYCGHHDQTKTGTGLNLDHYRSAKGMKEEGVKDPNAPHRIVTACLSCNAAKQAKTPRQWNAYVKGKDPPPIVVDPTRLRAQMAKPIDRTLGVKLAEEAKQARANPEQLRAQLEHWQLADFNRQIKAKAAKEAKAQSREAASKEAGPGVQHDKLGRFS